MKLELKSLEIHNEQVADTVWRTTHDFQFWADGVMLSIPSPFYHDKYSVPWPVSLVIKRDYKCPKKNMPAVLHDYLVRHRNLLGLSLMDCHCLFRQAMSLAGIPAWLISSKYAAVSSFNWIAAGAGDGTPSRKVRKAVRRINAQKTS